MAFFAFLGTVGNGTAVNSLGIQRAFGIGYEILSYLDKLDIPIVKVINF